MAGLRRKTTFKLCIINLIGSGYAASPPARSTSATQCGKKGKRESGGQSEWHKMIIFARKGL
jgi:hypothetical protein